MATKHYELADGVALVHYEGPCVVEADIDALPEWDALRGCVADGRAKAITAAAARKLAEDIGAAA